MNIRHFLFFILVIGVIAFIGSCSNEDDDRVVVIRSPVDTGTGGTRTPTLVPGATSPPGPTLTAIPTFPGVTSSPVNTGFPGPTTTAVFPTVPGPTFAPFDAGKDM